MKKIVGLVMVVAMLFVAMPTQAQVKFGIAAGVTMNKASLKNYDAISKSYTGWYVGPLVEIGIPIVGLAVDGSVQYAQNGASVEQNDGTNKHITQNSISVPLNLKYNIGIGSLASVFFSAGPQFDWRVGDKNKVFETSQYQLKNSQFSINVGGGFRVFDTLQLGLTYNISCGDASDGLLDKAGAAIKNNTWKLGAIVYF